MAYSRKTWGADGSVPRDGTRKREVFIHHTVTAPPRYTNNVAENLRRERAAMRQLEQMHQNQGWSTVGYSWVVFPTGRVYVGRGRQGLPAAQKGHNSGTLAIAFVGDFSSKLPTLTARRRVVGIIADLKKSHGIRVLGGHRDVFSTACPGNALYGRLAAWRKRLGMGRP